MPDKNLADLLLRWYQKNGRDLPWRFRGGAHPDPYVVLVSEFMLQQTTVGTVIPYFYRFMEKFPTIYDLAQATEEDVYQLWQGLGYYTRAKSLNTTAQMIVNQYDGHFPKKREDILKLKGIGPYTVASFLALAFNQAETVIDGNVMRIIARLYHLTDPLDEIKSEIEIKASALTSKRAPADYASAIMDLGATVCTPKNPQCLLCPWNNFCKSKDAPDLEQIPQKKKILQKNKNGFVYLIYNSKGDIFIRKRVEKGLLSGLFEFPWSDEKKLFADAIDTNEKVRHIFTHIKLTLNIYVLQADNLPFDDGVFVNPEKLRDYPLSTLMKKVWNKKIKKAPL